MSNTPNSLTDMRDVDGAIMDFQIHVRTITGGDDYTYVDSTNLKIAILKAIQETKREAYEEIEREIREKIKLFTGKKLTYIEIGIDEGLNQVLQIIKTKKDGNTNITSTNK